MSLNIGRSNYARRRKKTVDIDTSGPDATIDIEERKDEGIVESKSKKQRNRNKEQDKTFENERETKLEEKKDDDKLEEYSKGVQARIAKLTRKMREAERREQAAVEYAKAVEEKRLALEKDLKKLMLIILKNLSQQYHQV